MVITTVRERGQPCRPPGEGEDAPGADGHDRRNAGPSRPGPAAPSWVGGRSGIDRAPMARPVQLPRPVKINAPTPLASRHGSTTSIVCRRASPITSRIITAAMSGLPKIAEIAAADPAAAMMVVDVGVAVRPGPSDRQQRQPAADRDQGRLGSRPRPPARGSRRPPGPRREWHWVAWRPPPSPPRGRDRRDPAGASR